MSPSQCSTPYFCSGSGGTDGHGTRRGTGLRCAVPAGAPARCRASPLRGTDSSDPRSVAPRVRSRVGTRHAQHTLTHDKATCTVCTAVTGQLHTPQSQRDHAQPGFPRVMSEVECSKTMRVDACVGSIPTAVHQASHALKRRIRSQTSNHRATVACGLSVNRTTMYTIAQSTNTFAYNTYRYGLDVHVVYSRATARTVTTPHPHRPHRQQQLKTAHERQQATRCCRGRLETSRHARPRGARSSAANALNAQQHTRGYKGPRRSTGGGSRSELASRRVDALAVHESSRRIRALRAAEEQDVRLRPAHRRCSA